MSDRKSKKQTYFNKVWLSEEDYGLNVWLMKGTTETSFRCKICKGKKDLSLGQAGKGALKKHAEGDTHKNYMALHQKTVNLFQPQMAPSSNTSTTPAEDTDAAPLIPGKNNYIDVQSRNG